VYRQTSSLLQHIYAKTSKGHDEIVRPKFGLNPRQRRILMFVDGEHTLVTLHGHFPLQEMEEIVATLAGHHFIFMTGRQAQETASPCRRGKPRAAYTWRTGSELNSARHHDDVYPILTEDPEKILKAKELMLEIAAHALGHTRAGNRSENRGCNMRCIPEQSRRPMDDGTLRIENCLTLCSALS
jgi:hypothetical protein